MLVLVLLNVLLGAGYNMARQEYRGPGPLARTTDVVIPRGDEAEVGAALKRAGVIGNLLVFRIAALVTAGQGPLHAAELAFPAHSSLQQVLHILRTAPPVQHLLTIPEGLTAVEIARLINTAPALTGKVAPPKEGAALPQTYAYVRGMNRAAILARAEAAMRTTLAKLWAGRAKGLPIDTMREAVTLASIVERETALPAERPMVAAVYLNRLRIGMRLQADPTVIYAASHGLGTLDHPITDAELADPSAYNTYRHAGLPPGPICAPGIASLTAVLHPATTKDLYFVANGKGGHAFARTLAQHLKNVARYRALHQPPPASHG